MTPELVWFPEYSVTLKGELTYTSQFSQLVKLGYSATLNQSVMASKVLQNSEDQRQKF